MRRVALFLLFPLAFVCLAFAQTNVGELRLHVADPSGLGIATRVQLTSDANQYSAAVDTDATGNALVQRLPFGVYRIAIQYPNLADFSGTVDIHSELPTNYSANFTLASVVSSVTVRAPDTLTDPDTAGAVNRIGAATIAASPNSLPGRSLQDLVDSQPGWLYEGNAVLHPRGSEYQTQIVLDGIPLTDNRSPGFGTEIEAGDIDSLGIYTAGFPAEYGRKMGGVVEINTLEDAKPGLHGEVALDGGSYDTAGGFTRLQYQWGKNTLAVTANGEHTEHYLNPVVPQNFTNTGTTGDFSLRYDRNFTSNDRLSFTVRHELARYEIPNEQVQQSNGQLQNATNLEDMGVLSYQHTFSPDVVADFHGMFRQNSNTLDSNPLSTPVIAFQKNFFNEVYFKASVAVHRGKQEWKAGIESDNLFLHENFSDVITDPTQFDDGTPAAFSFVGSRPDLEQAAFVQDLIRFNNWTVSAGLRWDHYQLLVNQNAVSPRLAVARYFPSAGLVVHISYDRIFQTPSFENILLSSSPAVTSLDPSVLRLPVEPSHGDYYEAGVSKTFFSRLRLDVNAYRRVVNNYADDDQLLNTAVSFPIAFERAVIYGAETKLDLREWHRLSGFASYSWMVGNAWFPVTGGLFLGDDATNAMTQLSGHFPDSQDQRNTLRFRERYQLTPRLWFAGGADYGSGLPFDFSGTYDDALAQYGQQVVNRINFDAGRIRPSLIVNASAGVDVLKTDRAAVRFQVDGENLTNVLDVIDFGGLFSGNAIGPGRSYFLRLNTSF